MFFFDGCKCPYCGKEFKSDDDIVACPVCGTPHHRECYKSNEACAFDAEHDEGYRWKREEAVTQEENDADAVKMSRLCENCGAINSHDSLWCERCQRPLEGNPALKKDSAETAAGDGQPPQNGNGYFSFSGETSIPDGELIDGVPAGDLRRFIKGTSYYYVPLFAAFSRFGKKISFNLMALFTHGLWFLSRKMYALGAAVLMVMLAVNTFQSYCAAELDDLMKLYTDGDISEAYARVAELMTERPVLMYGMTFSVIVYYGVCIGCGIFSNWLYKQHCVKKVKKLNHICRNAEEFNKELDAKGGTAMPLAIGCAVLYVAMRVFLQNLVLK